MIENTTAVEHLLLPPPPPDTGDHDERWGNDITVEGMHPIDIRSRLLRCPANLPRSITGERSTMTDIMPRN